MWLGVTSGAYDTDSRVAILERSEFTGVAGYVERGLVTLISRVYSRTG